MEQMKRLRAENVELKKELLRLQHLEDQVQLLREENELLKEQNASLKQQTMVCNKKLTFFCKLVYIKYTERQHIYMPSLLTLSVSLRLCVVFHQENVLFSSSFFCLPMTYNMRSVSLCLSVCCGLYCLCVCCGLYCISVCCGLYCLCVCCGLYCLCV